MAQPQRPSNRDESGPSGRLVVWLAVLIFGIGVAMVFVYRSALVSHTGETSAAEAAEKIEGTRLQASAGASDDMRAAQAALLKTPAAAKPAAPSGPEASPAK